VQQFVAEIRGNPEFRISQSVSAMVVVISAHRMITLKKVFRTGLLMLGLER
jgi:hypothetical protein